MQSFSVSKRRWDLKRSVGCDSLLLWWSWSLREYRPSEHNAEKSNGTGMRDVLSVIFWSFDKIHDGTGLKLKNEMVHVLLIWDLDFS
jgi:hypothetical protein